MLLFLRSGSIQELLLEGGLRRRPVLHRKGQGRRRMRTFHEPAYAGSCFWRSKRDGSEAAMCVNLRVVPFASPEARDDTFGADGSPRMHTEYAYVVCMCVCVYVVACSHAYVVHMHAACILIVHTHTRRRQSNVDACEHAYL